MPNEPLAECVDRQSLLEVCEREFPYGSAVEVGVASAVFFRQIIATWKNFSRLIGVDIWKDQEDTYKCLCDIFKDEPRVSFIRDYSIVASDCFLPGTLDFVYIDADHHYSAVKADMECWYPSVKNGGILAGHDYDQDDKEGFDVKRAVDEFAALHKLTVYATTHDHARSDAVYPNAWEGQSWMIRKPKELS